MPNITFRSSSPGPRQPPLYSRLCGLTALHIWDKWPRSLSVLSCLVNFNKHNFKFHPCYSSFQNPLLVNDGTCIDHILCVHPSTHPSIRLSVFRRCLCCSYCEPWRCADLCAHTSSGSCCCLWDTSIPKNQISGSILFWFSSFETQSPIFYSGYTILPPHQTAHKGSDFFVSSLTLFYPLIFAIAVVVIMNIWMGLKWESIEFYFHSVLD